MLDRNHMHVGDALTLAAQLDTESVQCIATSPPYWQLRAYLPADHPDKARELGGEATPEAYIARLVAIFRELRRVLRPDGSLWLNLGDSYATQAGTQNQNLMHWTAVRGIGGGHRAGDLATPTHRTPPGYKTKDLIGIPWMAAFALRADGWYLRSEVIWAKPNPMPESVKDRPTRSHETVFQLTKSPRYFYDTTAIAEPVKESSLKRINQKGFGQQSGGAKDYGNTGGQNTNRSMRKTVENFAARVQSAERWDESEAPTRAKRDVWNIATIPYPESHFATFPPELIRTCILASTSERGACASCGAPWQRIVESEGSWEERKATGGTAGNRGTSADYQNGVHGEVSDHYLGGTARKVGWEAGCACGATTVPCVVLDPFMGSGTTAAVCVEQGRDWLGFDLDERNAALVEKRLRSLPVRSLFSGMGG